MLLIARSFASLLLVSIMFPPGLSRIQRADVEHPVLLEESNACDVVSSEDEPGEKPKRPIREKKTARPKSRSARGKPPIADGKNAGEVRDDNGIKLSLIWCPPGKFTMGSPPDEEGRSALENQANVELSRGLWLGKFEVTQAQWQRVMNTKPWTDYGEVMDGPQYPATHVNWFQVTDFCGKLTEMERRAGRLPDGLVYRLPTEAEWEYACRAGTKTVFSFGDSDFKLNQHAWYGAMLSDGNTRDQRFAHEVGVKKPNPWGLHDMHGNVMEWCSDWTTGSLVAGVDPTGAKKGTVRSIRGGSWMNDAPLLRSAHRNSAEPEHFNSDLGFRVALGLPREDAEADDKD